MEIHLRRLDRLVSEPKRDDRAIDAVLKEVHGRGVAKHVRCYVLPPEGRTAPPGDIAVAGPQGRESHPAPRPAAAARPVWIATSKRAWSRRPIQAVVSGAATRASISSRVRYSIGLRS